MGKVVNCSMAPLRSFVSDFEARAPGVEEAVSWSWIWARL
jgi:hypothetical protein